MNVEGVLTISHDFRPLCTPPCVGDAVLSTERSFVGPAITSWQPKCDKLLNVVKDTTTNRVAATLAY